MSIAKQKFGTLPSGEEVYAYTVDNHEGLKAQFIDYGCVITKLIVSDEDKGDIDVVLGRDTLEPYIKNPCCLGMTVGRYANRMRNSTFILNGEVYTQEPNEGKNICHSSWSNFGKRVWQAKYDDENANAISFELSSPDGENGYPGDLNSVVTFTLDGKKLDIHYEAVANKDTVVNFTNHSYFNLNGHASGTVLDHSLQIHADFYTPVDDELIPTGEILSVKGTALDFTEAKKIGRDIGEDKPELKAAKGGYDHNFVLRGTGLREIAVLKGDKTGLKMTTYTDKPGVQIYGGMGLGGEVYKDGAEYAPYQGVCLETQFFPNSMEYSHFPSVVVKCGEKYDYTTIYSFDFE